MPTTYPAVLRNHTLEWRGDAPPGLTPETAVEVLVTLPDPSADQTPRGDRMAAALEKLAGSALAEIADPVAWQREQRTDRAVPGRDE